MKIPLIQGRGGIAMPSLGLGTWQMGGREKHDPGDNGESCVDALRAGLKMGYTHIDTAEMYAAGFAEEIVGRAIEDSDRKDLFITSKVWKTHLHYDDVLFAVENSLKRLKTDYLDLCLVHQVDPLVKVSETMRAFSRLYDEKIIRNVGVSNFALDRLRHAMDYAPVVVDQIHYNLNVREAVETGLLSFCQENKIIVTAWRPLQKGAISSEKFLLGLAEKYGVSTTVIALAWLLNQPGITTITKSMNPEHLQENMQAAFLKLSADDMQKLTDDFPDQCKVSPTVPLL